MALTGRLPDACSRVLLVEETVRLEARRIELVVEVERPDEVVCAQVATPFALNLWVDTGALDAGEVVVFARGAEGKFVLPPSGDWAAFGPPVSGAGRPVIVLPAGLRFVGPGGWERSGLTWTSPPFWRARIGLRWHEPGSFETPESLLPEGFRIEASSRSRLGWGEGVRYRVVQEDEELWSEHLFATCAAGLLCEFWMRAPSEPLLDAAGEAFWRMIRFAARMPVG